LPKNYENWLKYVEVIANNKVRVQVVGEGVDPY